MAKAKKVIHVKNKDLLREIVAYKATGNYSEELGTMLLKMARKIGDRREFRGYSYLEDMISESVLTCLKYLHNFKPEKNTNAFAYVSTIIFNAFRLCLKKEKKHSKIKDKSLSIRERMIQAEVDGNEVSYEECRDLDWGEKENK